MLVHRRVIPQQDDAGTHLYTCEKRDKVEYRPLIMRSETIGYYYGPSHTILDRASIHTERE